MPYENSSTTQNDLSFESLIDFYVVKNSRFIWRDWLADEVAEQLKKPDCRLILLTAEPGAGKSAFMAQLAHDHPEWLRYFIRRDQRSVLADVSEKSLLMRIGYQLAARHPELFSQEQLRISITQRIDNVHEQAEAVGAEVKRLTASPFYQKVLEIEQQVRGNEGKVMGLRVEELVVEPQLLAAEDLLQLALIHPARALERVDPNQQIVILIDALDEIRYHPTPENILAWLISCPQLPENIRFVLSSRPPDEAINYFRAKQADRLAELEIAEDDVRVQRDVERFVTNLVAEEMLTQALSEAEGGAQAFARKAIDKAHGNLGYLDALARGMDQALARKDAKTLWALLSLKELPTYLEGLYAFFLHQIKASVARERVELKDAETGETYDKPVWPTIYDHILGVLVVAMEPLDFELIMKLGEIRAERAWVINALDHLLQFLDVVDGRYRLYHDTVAEFLVSKETCDTHKSADLFVDVVKQHRQIINYFFRLVGGWPNACWSEMDGYGWRHLLAHAEQAGPVRTAPILFEICDAGFLEAKRKTMRSTAALEDDWERSLWACRNVGDYGRFIRYGLQRAHQFMDISPLLSTPIARTNAQLAVRRRSEEAVDRLAAEISLIPHLHARILAEQAFLDELISAGSEFPAVEGLIRSLDLELAKLPAGEDRDRYLSAYMGALARARHPGWLEKVQAHLGEVKSFLPRVSLLALLARGSGEEGDGKTGFRLLHEALEQCEGITISDDLVPDLLQMMTGVERMSPATILVEGLSIILIAAPSLPMQDCARVVAAARTQFHRIMEQFDTSEAALQLLHLNRLAIQALDAAGLRDRAQEMAHEVMQPYLRMLAEKNAPGEAKGFVPSAQYAVELLALMPILIPFGSESDREVWWQLFRGSLADVSSDLDLRQIAQVAGDLSTIAVDDVEVDAVLQAVEDRASPLSFDDVGFVIAARLAQGYGRTNNVAHACDLVSRILDQVSAQQLGRSKYPEEAEFWANGITAVWAAACCCGERCLVERTLAWLQEIAFSAIPFDIRADLWLQAIIAVRDLSDLDLADDVFDELKPRSVENVERGPFLATACQQLADSYTELEVLSEAQRLLADCVRIARDTMIDAPRVNLLALAAGNYARLGDTKASIGLIKEALQIIPEIEGEKIQADCLEYTFNAINLLADASQSGRGEAMQLLEVATGIAQSIGLDEYALKALAFFVPKAAAHNLAAPVEAMTERLRELKEPNEASSLSTRLKAAWALHQAGKEQDARDLLRQVETAAYKMAQQEDYERNVLCEVCEELVAFLDSMAALRQATRWRELAVTLAGQIQDPQIRTSACASLARIEARFKDARSAGNWLVQAINAWHRIEERFYASSYIGDIYRAWAAIPDSEERWSRLDTMQTVFRRVPDIDERDAWQALLAISFLTDRARFRELMTPVVCQCGIDVLLSTLYNTEEISSGILPEALYDILEKASRLSRLGFAGFALLATQAGISHRVLDSVAAVPALVTLEAIFREIVVVDLMTSQITAGGER